MKRIQIPEGIKLFCLIIPLQLSPHRPGLNDMEITAHMPADYIDPSKSLFPQGNSPHSVDKWLPPGPERHVSVMDTAAQQRHFSDLKSRYFGMGAGEKSPWTLSYISSVLSKEAEAASDTSIRKYLGKQSVAWGGNFRGLPTDDPVFG
ncbi:hypothetical protein [unidentified bacterial endosymbiont]|uniref:hypothetical protein n=1 Tax=unidentified bacterial endosymbiont TaxID=2355 RepID=UPI00209FE371|nr:hypothetical protein [unidentified bacterial endosymbiont]